MLREAGHAAFADRLLRDLVSSTGSAAIVKGPATFRVTASRAAAATSAARTAWNSSSGSSSNTPGIVRFDPITAG